MSEPIVTITIMMGERILGLIKRDFHPTTCADDEDKVGPTETASSENVQLSNTNISVYVRDH